MSDLFVKRAASISECGTYRWTLQRRWAAGERVCWIMLNPSTADAERDDPTVLRCMAFSRSWGYGGLIVVNLYPFRSSKPAERGVHRVPYEQKPILWIMMRIG